MKPIRAAVPHGGQAVRDPAEAIEIDTAYASVPTTTEHNTTLLFARCPDCTALAARAAALAAADRQLAGVLGSPAADQTECALAGLACAGLAEPDGPPLGWVRPWTRPGAAVRWVAVQQSDRRGRPDQHLRAVRLVARHRSRARRGAGGLRPGAARADRRGSPEVRLEPPPLVGYGEVRLPGGCLMCGVGRSRTHAELATAGRLRRAVAHPHSGVRMPMRH
jgi:hypothetical protein